MAGLNLGIIKELKIKLPTIELQNKFEKIYHETMNIKSFQKQSSEYINRSFNILLQKVSKGELIC